MVEIVARPLGWLELYQLSKQTTDVYGLLCMTATMRFAFGTTANSIEHIKSIVYPAVSSLCKRISHLSLAITDLETSTPKFIHLPHIDLNRLVTIEFSSEYYDDSVLSTNYNNSSNSNYITKSIERELSRLFDLKDRSMPLWRLKVLTNEESNLFTLILVTHHVIADGLSTLSILKQLLDTIYLQQLQIKQQKLQLTINTNRNNNNNRSNGNIEEIYFDEDNNNNNNDNNKSEILELEDEDNLKVSEPFEKRTTYHPNALNLMPEIVKNILPSFIKKQWNNDYWAGNQHAVKEMHNTRLLLFTFEDIPSLLRNCRKNNTTPHAVIYLATIMATLKVFGGGDEKGLGASLKIHSQTPISARKYCTPETNRLEVGNFVASYDRIKQYSYSKLIDSETFWKECRNYKKELVGSTIDSIKSVNMLKYLGEFPKAWNNYWLEKFELPMGRVCSFEMSDLGVIELNNTAACDPYDIIKDDNGRDEMVNQQLQNKNAIQFISPIYAQSCNVVGGAFNINIITTNNTLTGTITWHLDAITSEQALQLIANIKATLFLYSIVS